MGDDHPLWYGIYEHYEIKNIFGNKNSQITDELTNDASKNPFITPESFYEIFIILY